MKPPKVPSSMRNTSKSRPISGPSISKRTDVTPKKNSGKRGGAYCGGKM